MDGHRDAQQDEPSSALHVLEASEDRYRIVRGIRYVVPYLQEKRYSVRLRDAGKSLAGVLAVAHPRAHVPLADAEAFFRGEIERGRIRLQRSKTTRDDVGPFTGGFHTVVDSEMVVQGHDLLKIQRHIHERCTLHRGPIHTLRCGEMDDDYRAVVKPAGLPSVNDEGDCHGSVAGLIRQEGYYVGHRLDLPVSGVLLIGKGKSRAQRITRALDAEGKQQDGFLKAYLARVKGGENLCDDTPMEVKLRLKWNNREKKAVVAEPQEEKARDTITRVTRTKWDADTGESIVRVELITGARQQIRSVLASMNIPIVGDVKYGGGELPTQYRYNPPGGELRLYADDENGTLQAMLDRERKEWCDKCRWQTVQAKEGGSLRGVEELTASICLLSYHYKIPSLRIDVRIPDDMIPEWAK